MYGALVVKGDVSLDRNRVVVRPPATRRGRDRRWSVACRPALSFRDSAVDYPANHGIPLAGGPRWRRRRPSVRAVEQDAGLVARVAQDVAGAAGRGAGLAVGLSSSGQRRGGVWTCGIPIVNRDSHVSQDDPRGTRQWTPNIASTLLYSGVWSRPDHDAAMRIDGKVPGRRAHSLRRRESHACLGSPPPRIVINAPPILTTGVGFLGAALLSTGCSRRGTEHDAVRHFAGGDQPPQRDEQLAR